MLKLAQLITFAFVVATASTSVADTTSKTNGSDTFIAGSTVTETLDAEREVFIAGRAVTAKGASRGDTHVAGFDLGVRPMGD